MSDQGAASSCIARWQPTALDAPPAPPDVAPALCAPDLATTREAARQAGFEDGWREGSEQGRAAGYAEGHAEGLAAGRDAGHAEGHAAGLAAGEAVVREEAARLAALNDTLAQSLRALEADMGQALLALALAVAQKIVGDTLARTPEAVLDCVRDCINAVLRIEGDAAPVCLWLHPDDLAIVNAHLGETLREHDWRVIADAALARGGCRVETALGEIDATLQTRWQQAVTQLVGSA